MIRASFLVDSVGKMLVLVAFMIITIAASITVYLFYFLIEERKKFLTMTNFLGMEKSDVRKEFLIELFVVIGLAFIVSMYISFILLRIINYATSLALDFPVRLFF